MSLETTTPFILNEVPEGTAIVGISRVTNQPVIVMSVIDEPQGQHAGICLDTIRAIALYQELGLLIHSITESPNAA